LCESAAAAAADTVAVQCTKESKNAMLFACFMPHGVFFVALMIDHQLHCTALLACARHAYVSVR
jgi:hypothetical protein